MPCICSAISGDTKARASQIWGRAAISLLVMLHVVLSARETTKCSCAMAMANHGANGPIPRRVHLARRALRKQPNQPRPPHFNGSELTVAI